MIRKISLKIMMLAVMAVFMAGTPVLVQADIFLKPHGSKNEENESGEKKSFKSYLFNPFKKKSPSKQGNVEYYKGKNIYSKMAQHSSYYKAPPVNPEFLSQAGESPKTAKDIMAVASAHKESKINAVKHMSEINAVFFNKKMEQYAKQASIIEAQQERMLARKEAQKNAKNHKNAVQASASKKPRKKIYLTPSSVNLKKPNKVFNRNR